MMTPAQWSFVVLLAWMAGVVFVPGQWRVPRHPADEERADLWLCGWLGGVLLLGSVGVVVAVFERLTAS